MAQITSPHVWYPQGYPGPAYDLREVMSWSDDQQDPTLVNVRFVGDTVTIAQFDKALFEAAKQNSLDNDG